MLNNKHKWNKFYSENLSIDIENFVRATAGLEWHQLHLKIPANRGLFQGCYICASMVIRCKLKSI